jgi:hypothetical protein
MLYKKKTNYKLNPQHTLRYTFLFQQKKKIIHTLLFLNTAFSMIDRMFQQEILNGKLRQKYWLRFKLNDFLSCCCCCNYSCLPAAYIEPEKSGGNILQNLMCFDKHIEMNEDDDDNNSNMFVNDDSNFYNNHNNNNNHRKTFLNKSKRRMSSDIYI